MRQLLFVLLSSTFLVTGCVSTKPDTAALKAMKKVALVTITLERVGKGPENDPVLKSAAGFANTVYRQELATIPQWQIVDASGIAELDRHFSDIGSSAIAKSVLTELADQNQLNVNLDNAKIAKLTLAAFSGNQQAMTQMKNEIIADTLALLQKDLDGMRSQFYWPKGTAGIPAGWMAPYGADQGRMAALNKIIARILEDYRVSHGLDGVLLVHQISEVGTPGDIRVIVQSNRVLSSIKVNPTVTVRGAGGKVVLAEGSSRRDDLAPMKLAMPIYAGQVGNGPIKDLKLSLADPAGKGQEGYYALISETAKDVMDDVRKVLSK